MDFRELRIGNYYQAKSPEKKEYEPKYRLDGSSLCQAINNQINLKPIPIAEIWIKRMGFNMANMGVISGWSIDVTRPSHSEKELFCIMKSGDNPGCWVVFLTQISQAEVESDVALLRNDIEYVHEIQNLYFQLFKKEIDVK